MSDKHLGPVCTNGHGASARTCRQATCAWRAALAGALLALAAFSVRPAAADAVGGSRVLWAEGTRLYLAVADSGALAPRMLVRVFDREREVARGEVEGVLDGRVASVRLEAPLDARARLDRLDVVLESAPSRRVAVLRVGLPASARRALAPPCGAVHLEVSALPRAYREEPLADGATRLVAADSGRDARWPDTLLVRTFADRADEEIALERGDLDVAVFWPGEPSARLRDRASGFELLRGLRARGLVVARGDEALLRSATVDSALATLNAELFGGDLLSWRRLVGADSALVAASHARVRYLVGPGLPGRAPMERLLNRGARMAARPPTVALAYEDDTIATREALEASGVASPTTVLFALRCPVVCSAGRAADVRALGAAAFANLADCGGGRRP